MSIRRLRLAGLVSLCMLAGTLALSSAPAVASEELILRKSFSASENVPFENAQSVAIEQSTGDVYVLDITSEHDIYKFDSSGNPVNFSGLGGNVIKGVQSVHQYSSEESEIAVDNSAGPTKGDIYVADGGEVDVYGPDGKPLEVGGKPIELNSEVTTVKPGAPWGEPCGVAVDSAGDVYVGLYEGGTGARVNEYTPTGGEVSNADYTGSLWGLEGICNIAVDTEAGEVSVYTDKYPAGPVMEYSGSQINTIETPATGSVVSLVGSELTVDLSTHSLYVDEGDRISKYSSAGEFQSAFSALEGSAGLAVYGSTGEVYLTYGNTVAVYGPPPHVAPTVLGESTTEVTGDSATLQAQINHLFDTTYYFQYGTDDSYGASVPLPPGTDIGPGTETSEVSVHVQNLAPGTTYHYRIVAVNEFGPGEGVDATFTTQATEGAFALPEGREYEMVSPPNKDGAETGAFNIPEGGLEQASEDGNAITYLESNPVGENPAGNVQAAQMLARRSSEGWTSEDIATPNTSATSVGLGHGQEYRLFSPDLSVALLEPKGKTTLSPDAPSKERNLYLRDNGNGAFEPLVTTRPSEEFTAFGDELRIVGASKDLSHVVFTSLQALVSPAIVGGGDNLYEWVAGKLQLVNILPDGEPTPAEAGLGGRESEDTRNAISENGELVIWTDEENLSVYVRNIVTGKTVLAGQGEYQTASKDASRIFSIDNGQLQEFDVNSDELNTVTPSGARVKGVLGASEGGSSVYFVAEEALAAGAQEGADNLYRSHLEGSSWAPPSFVATLAPSDDADWEAPMGTGENLTHITSRVSPNGRYVAFMSSASLTGYDNHDALSGQPDVEVYIYDSASPGRLACASCNPTGARPVGELDTTEALPLPIDQSKTWEGQWLAASIPSWTATAVSFGLYQPRYLLDSGRLFFDSVDGLVAHDTNGRLDVYEYVPSETAGCQRTDGCVSLISAGTGSADSSFVDASASGDDVFFLTRDRLLTQDYDDSYDLYDAHLCSASAPCIPRVSVAPPPCTTGDACRAAPSPQPAIFGAPASATFSGNGNLVQSTTVQKAKPKKRKTTKGKTRKGRAKKGGAKKKRTATGRKGKRAKRSRARSLTLNGGATR